jgi:hypothetical protein
MIKKSLLACLVVFCFSSLSVFAAADIGFFEGVPAKITNKSVKGVRFGIPCAVSNGTVKGAELSLCYSASRNVDGFKFAMFGVTEAKELDGASLAFVNLCDDLDDGVQIGLYNRSGKGGVQVGFVNQCDNNAEIQIGIVNINRNGWLPVSFLLNFGDDTEHPFN